MPDLRKDLLHENNLMAYRPDTSYLLPCHRRHADGADSSAVQIPPSGITDYLRDQCRLHCLLPLRRSARRKGDEKPQIFLGTPHRNLLLCFFIFHVVHTKPRGSYRLRPYPYCFSHVFLKRHGRRNDELKKAVHDLDSLKFYIFLIYFRFFQEQRQLRK